MRPAWLMVAPAARRRGASEVAVRSWVALVAPCRDHQIVLEDSNRVIRERGGLWATGRLTPISLTGCRQG